MTAATTKHEDQRAEEMRQLQARTKVLIREIVKARSKRGWNDEALAELSEISRRKRELTRPTKFHNKKEIKPMTLKQIAKAACARLINELFDTIRVALQAGIVLGMVAAMVWCFAEGWRN
jgi:hypothetical protein